MLKKSFILAAALAVSAAPALSADGVAVKVPTTTEEITLPSPILLLNKAGPLQGKAHEYTPVANTTLTVEACNYDRQMVKIEGEIFADKTPNETVITNFRSAMQATYARGIIQYATGDLTPVSFSNQVNEVKTAAGEVPPNNYKEMNRLFNAVTRATEARTGIKMIFMPRLASIGPVNPDCPQPPKR